MSKLTDRLARLESQLQTIIEHSTTRFVHTGEQNNQFSSSLVEAMQSSVKIDQAGNRVAADTYIVIVNNDTAQIFTGDPSINETLHQLLLEAAGQLGTAFQAPPKIKISVDDSMVAGRFRIMPSFSLQGIPETSTITVDPSEELTSPENAFLIIDGTQVIPLTGQVLNLGRRPDNQIVIDNPKVSRKHAQLRVIKNRYVIFDLESTGGTYVNKIRIQQASLFPGDVISLAGVELVYGQEAGFFSGDSGSTTQPLRPETNSDI